MEKLSSYPSIFNIGHRNIVDLFADAVVVQEKVDGSQFSFGKNENGEILCRSKGTQIVVSNPDRMFARAVETVQSLVDKLIVGAEYRGECVNSLRHNTLTYERMPVGNIILFDVELSPNVFATPVQLVEIGEHLGLEVVPIYFEGVISDSMELQQYIGRMSVLGGVPAEGMVVKNYHRLDLDDKPLFGKFVRQDFKEMNKVSMRVPNPTQGDIIQNIIDTYKNDVRWKKAVQHLRDNGQLKNGPEDIGSLMKEIPADILKEHEQDIKDALFTWAWHQIKRGVTMGFPEWYKSQLFNNAFE